MTTLATGFEGLFWNVALFAGYLTIVLCPVVIIADKIWKAYSEAKATRERYERDDAKAMRERDNHLKGTR